MSTYTQNEFRLYQERMKDFSTIYNQDTDKAVKHVIGFDEKHAAYRYVRVHGAVELMGGWANFSYWIQNHASNYFRTCEKLETLANRLINQLPKNRREEAREQLSRILKDGETESQEEGG